MVQQFPRERKVRKSPPNLKSSRRRSNERRTSSRTRRGSSGMTQPPRRRRTQSAQLPKIDTKTPRSPAKRKSRSPKRPVSPGVYMARLLIIAIGLGAIAGSILSAVSPTGFLRGDTQVDNPPEVQATPPPPATIPIASVLSQEMASLKAEVQEAAAENPQLTPGVFFVDLDTGAYLDIEGSTPFSAASMIKVPVLIAFFQDVDAGKVRLDEMLTMTEEVVGGGSGTMQYQKVGTQFTALETAAKMIIISDNTATNMIIDRLGGAEAVNERFRSWGLTNTVINNYLPDLEGTNLTTPRELATLMATVSKGELISSRSRDWVMDIMKRTATRTLLPQGLKDGAVIAHKTGDIGSMVGDVGMIDMPNGKRYLGVAMMKRPHNDPRAQALIRRISGMVYEHFEQYPNPLDAPLPVEAIAEPDTGETDAEATEE